MWLGQGRERCQQDLRVEQHPAAAHVSADMTTVVKRLLTFCLALAFLAGATVQALPSSMMMAENGVRADMGTGCAGPDMPCTGHMPSCIDHLSCLTVPALPASPNSLAVAFEWTPLDSDLGAFS